MNAEFLLFLPFLFVLIILVAIWEMIWKGIALWKAGRNNHLTWFVFIFIFNTAGILPIIYIFFFSKPKKETVKKEKPKIKPVKNLKKPKPKKK